MNTYRLTIPRTAHVHVWKGEETITQCWLLIHGYGQSAEGFLQSLDYLRAPHRLLVAPEGLSKFYLKSITGEVGASWMTRAHRLDEINDYIGYLNTVWKDFLEPYRNTSSYHALGFSQGVPTLCRWLNQADIRFSQLVLAGEMFPPELRDSQTLMENVTRNADVHLMYGTQDKLLQPEHIKDMEEWVRRSPEFTLHKFEGRHEVSQSVMEKITAPE